MIKEELIKIEGLAFTVTGLIVLIMGNTTNGLLYIIAGELIDLSYRIKDHA